jgi:drug/metabolite transporter (DMT)-like permease
MLGILPICVGVMLAVYEEAHNEVTGIVLCGIATIANALRTALSRYITTPPMSADSLPRGRSRRLKPSETDGMWLAWVRATCSHLLQSKLDVFSMTWYTGPVSALVLLPFAIYKESRCDPVLTHLPWHLDNNSDSSRCPLVRFSRQALAAPLAVLRSLITEYAHQDMQATMGILLFGSMLALVYNVILFLTIKTLTGVTMNVMGNIKIIFLLLMSRLTLGELSGAHATGSPC